MIFGWRTFSGCYIDKPRTNVTIFSIKTALDNAQLLYGTEIHHYHRFIFSVIYHHHAIQHKRGLIQSAAADIVTFNASLQVDIIFQVVHLRYIHDFFYTGINCAGRLVHFNYFSLSGHRHRLADNDR